MIGNFRRVPMREKIVRAEIFIHLDEMRLALRFFARPADARFAVADDSARAVDPIRFDQRPQAQDHRCRIAAGIRDEPRFRKRAA